jgi:putative ABC transport system ATP-binding protein
MITAKNIVKTYGKAEESVRALDNVDVNINAGEFVAVMGPSGSGKSTLLFALSGTDVIDSGSIEFGGAELSTLKENDLADVRRTKMGFVFQQPTMLKNLNLLDNIILPTLQKSKKNLRGAKTRAKALMELTGISDLEERDIAAVSGGQLQRAGICRALINSPEILFADEPTGALNSKSAEGIMDLLVSINKTGTAILLVTHDAKVAARADKVLFTQDGKIVSQVDLGDFDKADVAVRTEKVTGQMAAMGI